MEGEISEKSSDDRKDTKKKYLKTRIVLKILLFLICAAGFAYQTSTFLSYYWSYPTVIEMIVERDREYILPAFTYCIVPRNQKIKYCQDNPKKCYEKPNNCRKKQECENTTMVPDPYDIYNDPFPLDDLKDPGFHVPYHFLNIDAQWDRPHVEHEGPFFYALPGSGEVLTCYTLNSLVDSKIAPVKRRMGSGTSMSEYIMKNMVERYEFRPSGVPMWHIKGYVFHIHSPFHRELPSQFNILELPENSYIFEMNMEEEHLLPAPYRTDCTDYALKWEKNNKTGPRSEKHCRALCEAELQLKCKDCVSLWNMYADHKMKCLRAFEHFELEDCNSTLKQEFEKCDAGCKTDCLQLKYSYKIKEVTEDPWDVRQLKWHTLFRRLTFELHMEPEVKIFNHRPQFQAVELFSNLGGYIGIWLGVSLFALTDALRTTVSIFWPYLLRHGFSKSRKSKEVENKNLDTEHEPENKA